MIKFSKRIDIIGINHYVTPPPAVLAKLFKQAHKQTSPIPVRGYINGQLFYQTLVRYQGDWRLYVNTPMLKSTGLKVNDKAEFEIIFDNVSRVQPMNPELAKALKNNAEAAAAFHNLTPGRKKEILRYLNNLRSPQTLHTNVGRVIGHLLGKDTDSLYPLMRRTPPNSVEKF